VRYLSEVKTYLLVGSAVQSEVLLGELDLLEAGVPVGCASKVLIHVEQWLGECSDGCL
jgi:hypothetical protein